MRHSMNMLSGVAVLALLGAAQGCGQAASQDVSDTKIIGGAPVPEGQQDERRWSTVALTTDFQRDPANPSTLDANHSFCSGTIVAPRIILTAAHCVQKFDATTREKLDELILPTANDFLIFFGTTVSRSGKWLRAAAAIPHPDWSPAETLSPQPTAAPNDIAVIVLGEDVPAEAKIAEIGEPTDSLPARIALAGYGVTTSRNTNDTGILRQVESAVTGNDAAVKRIGVGEFFRGACAGDSGGPAYVQKNGKYVVVGATSTGAEIAGQCLGLMNNYTDARYYKDWVLNR